MLHCSRERFSVFLSNGRQTRHRVVYVRKVADQIHPRSFYGAYCFVVQSWRSRAAEERA